MERGKSMRLVGLEYLADEFIRESQRLIQKSNEGCKYSSRTNRNRDDAEERLVEALNELIFSHLGLFLSTSSGPEYLILPFTELVSEIDQLSESST